MKLLYFAWVRERIGLPQEEVDLPAAITTVGDLLAWLKTRGPEFESALEHDTVIRVAIDRVHVGHETPIAGAREIALFPPMTGG